MRKIIILISLVLSLLLKVLPVSSQQLVLSGKVMYERRENMHKQFTGQSSWNEEMKRKMPKYRVDQFQLAFNKHRSLYKLVQEDESPFSTWWKVAAANTVANDLDHNRALADKNVYEKDYRIDDSLPVYRWKMLPEFRDIAGYHCRKASTIIMDSLYIIAFYTDEIPVSSGPESFQGLPGMILGIVIPRMNITLFATRVEHVTVAEPELDMPSSKNKKVTKKSFADEIRKAVKDWGEYATKIYWKVMI